ncbi:MAG: tRNA glutamyl-Q(34) synthetase GluQRS [Rhodobacteraceae bacterium]|nr:tRNA glutamyl-Q(34) synthetase GluQRS [Paracoccaceae bacterium]
MRERFAPSPTGFLHIGHAFSALTAWRAAMACGGEFLLRIEDIDVARCKARFEVAIYEDLGWLGLTWRKPVMRQSERLSIYADVLSRLVAYGLCYPCRCSRKDIAAALSAPQESGWSVQDSERPLAVPAHSSPESGKPSLPPVYPGMCRGRSMDDLDPGDAIRLDLRRAIELIGGEDVLRGLGFAELGSGSPIRVRITPESLNDMLGDVVLARKDIGTSYHIAVVTDDAMQSVTHVTRGEDIAFCTPLHVLLQTILGFPTPIYRHHRLIRDRQDVRLAKRHDAVSIRSLRERGKTPDDILSMVGLEMPS